MNMGQTVKQAIEARLVAGFPGAKIDVIDESHKHAGHAGARPEGETHFQVTLISPAGPRLYNGKRLRKTPGL